MSETRLGKHSAKFVSTVRADGSVRGADLKKVMNWKTLSLPVRCVPTPDHGAPN